MIQDVLPIGNIINYIFGLNRKETETLNGMTISMVKRYK